MRFFTSAVSAILALQAGLAYACTKTISGTILIIARDNADAANVAAGFKAYGIKTENLIVPNGGTALPVLNSTIDRGNYGGIVTHAELSYENGGNFASALTTEQWNALYQYQVDFGVRMARIDAYPTTEFGKLPSVDRWKEIAASNNSNQVRRPYSALLMSSRCISPTHLSSPRPMSRLMPACLPLVCTTLAVRLSMPPSPRPSPSTTLPLGRPSPSLPSSTSTPPAVSSWFGSPAGLATGLSTPTSSSTLLSTSLPVVSVSEARSILATRYVVHFMRIRSLEFRLAMRH